MPRLKLLILDACVVIKLHEYGIWNHVVDTCEIYLSRVVAEDESQFYPVEDERFGKRLDLTESIAKEKIRLFEVPAAEVQVFKNRFDRLYFGEMDAGEAESLAFLVAHSDRYLIASADAIVYKILGNLGLGDQGLSLEEVLQQCGRGRRVDWGYSKAFREHYTNQGFQDRLRRAQGLKRSALTEHYTNQGFQDRLHGRGQRPTAN